MSIKKVVITGIGPLSSAGIGSGSTWENLITSKNIESSREKIFTDNELWEEFYLHRLPQFTLSQLGIDASVINAIHQWKEGETVTDLEYLLAAVKLALDDADLIYDFESNDIGCIITHENPGLEQYFSKLIDLSYAIRNQDNQSKKEFAQYIHNKSIKSAYELQSFTVLFQVMKAFNLHGYSLFLNNACSSGLHAFESANQIIQSGRCPVVVIAGADYPRIYKYLWFKELNMYESDGKMKPFDKNARGLVFGDGGAGFILEDSEHAEKRGAKIYAEYLGGGFSQEAWKNIFPRVGSSYYQKAIHEALLYSHCQPNNIDVLCVHGAAHPLIDRYEASAVCQVFGEVAKQPTIAALKPYVGHNLGGNNLIEIAIMLLCMKNNVLLPLRNTELVHPKISLNLIHEKIEREINTVMKICCAFAGYNAAAVFRKFKG